MAATHPMSQDQDRSGDIKMNESDPTYPTTSTSSTSSTAPTTSSTSPVDTFVPYDPYEISTKIVKFDPIDARELKNIFGEDKYMYFRKDTKHQQYQLSLFLISENPRHYTWEGAFELIEALMNGNRAMDVPKSLTKFISCINPKKKGGFAVSCTYRFVHNMDKPGEMIEIYELINKYLANNDDICNYIGSDKKTVRCHFHTNRDQVYNHNYLIYNIPLNIGFLDLLNKQNAVKVTEFIEANITTQRRVERFRWERKKSDHSGLITQTIELDTLKPIKINNKEITTLDINWTVGTKSTNRIVKIINTKRPTPNERFRIYAPEDVETNFMRVRRVFEEKKNQKDEDQYERDIGDINNNFLNQRLINQSRNNTYDIYNVLSDLANNNNNHNHNRRNVMDIDHLPPDNNPNSGGLAH